MKGIRLPVNCLDCGTTYIPKAAYMKRCSKCYAASQRKSRDAAKVFFDTFIQPRIPPDRLRALFRLCDPVRHGVETVELATQTTAWLVELQRLNERRAPDCSLIGSKKSSAGMTRR